MPEFSEELIKELSPDPALRNLRDQLALEKLLAGPTLFNTKATTTATFLYQYVLAKLLREQPVAALMPIARPLPEEYTGLMVQHLSQRQTIMALRRANDLTLPVGKLTVCHADLPTSLKFLAAILKSRRRQAEKVLIIFDPVEPNLLPLETALWQILRASQPDQITLWLHSPLFLLSPSMLLQFENAIVLNPVFAEVNYLQRVWRQLPQSQNDVEGGGTSALVLGAHPKQKHWVRIQTTAADLNVREQTPLHTKNTEKIQHQMKRIKVKNPLKGKVDFGIITMKEEEFAAVLKRCAADVAPVELEHRTYAISRIKLDGGGSYTVAIIRCLDQGNIPAMDTTRDLIEDLDPRWILLVGIGGAVPSSEFTLGDVVLARRFLDFCIEENLNGQTRFGARGGAMHKEVRDKVALLKSISHSLGGWNTQKSLGLKKPTVDLSSAKSFYGSKEWKQDVKQKLTQHFVSARAVRRPLFTDQPVATSDRLMKSSITVEQWRNIARDVALFEMELGGVYEAAQRKRKAYPVLAIRGISDIVGFKRSPAWTEYACHTAAAFAFAFIKSKVIAPKTDENQMSERVKLSKQKLG